MTKSIAFHFPKIHFPKQNNLEWLRLAFALQVVFSHATEHFEKKYVFLEFLRHFPGVPAFFFVSGFLIYASYLNAQGSRYFQNRFLRLFPGLVFVTTGGMVIVLLSHGPQELIEKFPIYSTWFLAQITLGQAYNPALFRDVGVGVINGSLWTLTTEIIFYALVPVIARTERSLRSATLLFTFTSFLIYAFGPIIWTKPIFREKTFYDILSLTPIVWGWMFGFGILAAKHYSIIKSCMRFLPFGVIPLGILIWLGLDSNPLFGATNNRLGIFYFFFYVAIITWLAFGTKYLKLSFDISYGTYVWHMPIINLLLIFSTPSILAALVLTIAFAFTSWFFIEKPALLLKKNSLKPIGPLQHP
ncbi:acyltransferase family protein [Variovorax sp. Varisp41]|uniref:acyltransferase family protein n=1 Tax=Variovorax sp. Varisp41 TaxID=3243033 RepID=UPI0039B5F692